MTGPGSTTGIGGDVRLSQHGFDDLPALFGAHESSFCDKKNDFNLQPADLPVNSSTWPSIRSLEWGAVLFAFVAHS